ncbi:MAG: hypothetical protein JJLCMIEE_01710 [Acidimicrobiales bacterium]|nr:MAG: nitroreductase family deazaflavin-dependent oxidoreductase [Actinomycetota bacterium]MBV6508645.1 hypothetical protein [Acidimicrobiales bacterium]RIK08089.1 MAG: nitroreductase family deazaflavin-dependent oxidoreductase [Acidobacteriota bacterium]
MSHGSRRIRFSRSFAHWHNRVLVRTNGRPRLLTPKLRVLVLVTTGRRTGRERRVTLVYMPAGRDFVVLASNFGSEQAPAWLYNLDAEPAATVYVSGRAIPVVARRAGGEEGRELLQLALDYNRHWRTYEAEAARDIPVVLLQRSP